MPTLTKEGSTATLRDSSLGVRKYCPVCLMPDAIRYPTDPTISTAPTANFVPAVIFMLPLYIRFDRPVHRRLRAPAAAQWSAASTARRHSASRARIAAPPARGVKRVNLRP